jgi:hypothetical protein
MPPKRSPDIPKKSAECILRYGKSNDVIQWAEEMQTEMTALCGLTGMFFTTNRSHRPPRVTEEIILKSFYESDEEEGEYEDEYDDDDGEKPTSAQVAARAAAAAARTTALAKAQRHSADCARRKDLRTPGYHFTVCGYGPLYGPPT